MTTELKRYDISYDAKWSAFEYTLDYCDDGIHCSANDALSIIAEKDKRIAELEKEKELLAIKVRACQLMGYAWEEREDAVEWVRSDDYIDFMNGNTE